MRPFFSNHTTFFEKRKPGKSACKFPQRALIHIFSVTKSVVNILIGIAIDQGYLKFVDQRVLEFFPDDTVKRGEKTIQWVMIRDIMTMIAPYKYKSAPYTKYLSSERGVKASLDLLEASEIGNFVMLPS